MGFKVGDTVRIKGNRESYTNHFDHKIGKILCFEKSDGVEWIGVEFMENVSGHSCNGKCKFGYGFYFLHNEIKSLKGGNKGAF